MTRTVAIDQVPTSAIDALLDRAFGADRHLRTAYRLRECVGAIRDMSFALLEGDVLAGSIQCWPVLFSGDYGARTPLVMVGPVAVAPERQGDGLGHRLMQVALAVADARNDALMLIGDSEYYGRFFGFTAERTGAWRVPGPVERHRLLARGAAVPGGAGSIGPRVAVTA